MMLCVLRVSAVATPSLIRLEPRCRDRAIVKKDCSAFSAFSAVASPSLIRLPPGPRTWHREKRLLCVLCALRGCFPVADPARVRTPANELVYT
jgi:hypothetical protein